MITKGPVSAFLAPLLLILGTSHPALAAPGDLDQGFGSGGKVMTGIVASNLALQPDSKIVVAGLGVSGPSPGFGLARFNPDGTFDASFGSGGTVITEFSNGAAALALQPDGKIVVAGGTRVTFPAPVDFALARYNPDGALDATFGSGGKVVTDFGGANEGAKALAVQPDGKIVMAGTSSDGALSSFKFAVARYNPDGSLDSTFGAGGKVTTSFGGFTRAFALALQPDGKIVVAGQALSQVALARYNSDGTLDATFGSGGRATGVVSGIAFAVALQLDGKIVVAGEFLARYSSSGHLDPTFGSGGVVPVSFGGRSASAVAIQVDGKIMAGGETSSSIPSGGDDFALARYNVDGTLDATFGSGGRVVTDFGSMDEEIRALALQPDGKIVVVGPSPCCTNSILARYLGDPVNQLAISLTLNQTAVRSGDALVLGTRRQRQGPAVTADFYLGALLPDGVTIVFVTNLSPLTFALGNLNDPRTFRPLFADLLIPENSDVTTPNLLSFTFSGAEPPGAYVAFAALAQPGAFVDGSDNPGDILAMDIQPFSFSP